MSAGDAGHKPALSTEPLSLEFGSITATVVVYDTVWSMENNQRTASDCIEELRTRVRQYKKSDQRTALGLFGSSDLGSGMNSFYRHHLLTDVYELTAPSPPRPPMAPFPLAPQVRARRTSGGELC